MAQVVICNCSGRSDAAARDAVLAGLRSAGVAFSEADDLCGLAVNDPAALRELAADADLRIVACFPRAIRWLFAWAGAELSASTRILNARTQSADEILRVLAEASRPDSAGVAAPLKSEIQNPKSEIPWLPWFPVIDGDRCTSCRQCLNFCLFGVYSADARGKVRVVNPTKCKTNCPACARICPNAAIIFAKYPAAPINGDAVTPENLRRENVGGDVSAMVGGNLHEALKQRAAALAEASPPSGTPAAGLVPVSVQRILQNARDRAAARQGEQPQP